MKTVLPNKAIKIVITRGAALHFVLHMLNRSCKTVSCLTRLALFHYDLKKFRTYNFGSPSISEDQKLSVYLLLGNNFNYSKTSGILGTPSALNYI